MNAFIAYNPAIPQRGKRGQPTPETKRRHADENLERATRAVQELETKLGVTKRWTPVDEEYQQAAVLVSRRRYQRCLDELEGLVVSRMFELAKMNMSQTGEQLGSLI